MILDFAVLVQRQRHEAVDRFCEMHEPRRVFLLQFEDDLVRVGGGGDDFGGERAGGGHDFGDAWGCVVVCE